MSVEAGCIPYDGSALKNLTEETPLPERPPGIYSTTKNEAEKVFRFKMLEILMSCPVRPRLIWGRDDNSVSTVHGKCEKWCAPMVRWRRSTRPLVMLKMLSKESMDMSLVGVLFFHRRYVQFKWFVTLEIVQCCVVCRLTRSLQGRTFRDTTSSSIGCSRNHCGRCCCGIS